MPHLQDSGDGAQKSNKDEKLFVLERKPRKLLKELRKTIQTYIPYGDIPKNLWVSPGTKYWHGPDSIKHYEQRPHPDYGPRDVVYDINSYGYRSDEFDIEADFKVVTLGCSVVFGIGLPCDELFSTLVVRQIEEQTGQKVANWNLGVTGASNQTIARLLSTASETLKPDLVLINFTYLVRFEFVCGGSTSGPYHFMPHIEDEVSKELFIMANHNNCLVELYRNYKLIERTLQYLGIEWFWSAVNRDILLLQDHLDMSRFVGLLEKVDFARDHGHPGPVSNTLLCDKYMEKINSLGVTK